MSQVVDGDRLAPIYARTELPPRPDRLLEHEDFRRALVNTLYDKEVMVWWLPTENRFISAPNVRTLVAKETEVRLQIGDVAFFTAGHFFFIKILHFPPNTPSRVPERQLHAKHIASLQKGAALILAIQGPQDNKMYDVLLVTPQDHPLFKGRSKWRYRFSSLQQMFPPARLLRLSESQILQGELAQHILSAISPDWAPEGKNASQPEIGALQQPPEVPKTVVTPTTSPTRIKPAPAREEPEELANLFHQTFRSPTQIRLWELLLQDREYSLEELVQTLKDSPPATVRGCLHTLVTLGLIHKPLPNKPEIQLNKQSPAFESLCKYFTAFTRLVRPEVLASQSATEAPDDKMASAPTTPRRTRSLSHDARILEALSELGEMHAEGIAYHTGIDLGQVNTILQQLIIQGTLRSRLHYSYNPSPPSSVHASPARDRTHSSAGRNPTRAITKMPALQGGPAVEEKAVQSRPDPLLQKVPNPVLITTIGSKDDRLLPIITAVPWDAIYFLQDSKYKSFDPEHFRPRLLNPSTQLQLCPLSDPEIDQIHKQISGLIQKAVSAGQSPILAIAGGPQRVTIAILLAAYLNFNCIAGLIYTEGQHRPLLHLPLFPWASPDRLPANELARGALDLPFIHDVIPAPTHPTRKPTLLTTIGSKLSPLIQAIEECDAEKVVIFHSFSSTQFQQLRAKLTAELEVNLVEVSLNNFFIDTIAAQIIQLATQELRSERPIILNLCGGAERQTIAFLFASYFLHEQISDFLYTRPGDYPVIHLPRLAWHLPPK